MWHLQDKTVTNVHHCHICCLLDTSGAWRAAR